MEKLFGKTSEIDEYVTTIIEDDCVFENKFLIIKT